MRALEDVEFIDVHSPVFGNAAIGEQPMDVELPVIQVLRDDNNDAQRNALQLMKGRVE